MKKISAARTMISLFDRLENLVLKGVNAGI